ncbi:MAG: gamma-glutamyltransferase [Alphaproteobacteria bacterium]
MGNFAVASGHHLTTQTTAEVLRAGGTAVDAAIAGALMACVVEPVLASPLAGGFLMVSPPDKPVQILDAFIQTPKRKRTDVDIREIEVDFGPSKQIFHCGAGTIGTPGLIPGLFEAHAQFGRIPMVELAAPAIETARKGETVTAFQAEVLGYVAAIFKSSESVRALYAPNGKLLVEGDILANPDMADVLEVMALEGPRFFQEGEVAQALLSLEGSHLSADDLKSYRPIGRKPLRFERHGIEVDLNPSPSLGGVQIALVLQALPANPDDRQLARCLFEVAKIRKETDLDHHPASGEKILLNDKMVADLRKTLETHQAATRGTTHISVIDQGGMGAAFTISNGEGCGLIVPGTGIMANNMLGEDDLVPDGVNSWHEDTRLASMMCPMALRDGGLTMMGSGGSNRIRSALTQVALRLIDGGEALEEAVNAPRLHVDDTPQILDFEDTGSEERRAGLRADFPDATLWPRPTMYFGGVHAVSRDAKGGFSAMGDPRRSGTALTK